LNTTVALTGDERAYLDTSVVERDRQQAEEADRQRRELEAARKLAETERARAEEQTRSANRLRMRNRVIAAAGGIALLLAVLAGMFGVQSNQNAARAETNLDIAEANAATAQAESDRADKERDTAVAAQATAQAEAVIRRCAGRPSFRPAWPLGVNGRSTLDNLTVDSNLAFIGAARREQHMRLIKPCCLSRQALHQALLACTRLTLTGHQDAVLAVAYSPDGQRLACSARMERSRSGDVTMDANPSPCPAIQNSRMLWDCNAWPTVAMAGAWLQAMPIACEC
jgi:hypothetical protein